MLLYETNPEFGWVGPFVMATYNTRVVRRSAVLLDYGPRFRYSHWAGTRTLHYAVGGAAIGAQEFFQCRALGFDRLGGRKQRAELRLVDL